MTIMWWCPRGIGLGQCGAQASNTTSFPPPNIQQSHGQGHTPRCKNSEMSLARAVLLKAMRMMFRACTLGMDSPFVLPAICNT